MSPIYYFVSWIVNLALLNQIVRKLIKWLNKETFKSEEDWKKNPQLIEKICEHLDVDSLMSVRLACKDWSEWSFKPLLEKTRVKVYEPEDEDAPVTIFNPETHTSATDRFKSFVDLWQVRTDKIEAVNLQLGWCPRMTNHSIWNQLGTKVRNLKVYRLHQRKNVNAERDFSTSSHECECCTDQDSFLDGLLRVFSNIENLSLMGSSKVEAVSVDFMDYFDQFTEKRTNSLGSLTRKSKISPRPIVENLRTLSLDYSCIVPPEDIVASLIPNLQKLHLADNIGDKSQFYMLLNNIAESSDKLKLQKLSIRCSITGTHADTNGNEANSDYNFTVLKRFLSKCRVKSLKFWFYGEAAHILGFQPVLPWPSRNASFTFLLKPTDIEEASKKISNEYIRKAVWNSMSCKFQISPYDSEEAVAFAWKRTLPRSSVETLTISSNLLNDIDLETVEQLLPAATYVCVCRKNGRILGEAFGPARLITSKTNDLVQTVSESKSRNKQRGQHLMDMPEFRKHFGIPEEWFPTDHVLNLKGTGIYLVYMTIDFTLINSFRVNLSSYVYPERKLEHVYQIAETSVREKPKKTPNFIRWSSYECLQMASGKPIVENNNFKIFKSES